MQITVQSTKLKSNGTNEYGAWELVIVTSTEGVEYSTLADEAKLIPPGSIINITNMDKDKKGRDQFKKYEIVGKGQVSSSPEAKPNGDMTNEMWAEKQRIERSSIERQVAAKIAFEFCRDDDIAETLMDAELIYQWISGHSPSPKPTEPQSSPAKEKSDSNPRVFKNVGEFLTAMNEKGLSKTQVVVELIRLKLITDEADLPKLNLDEAWEALGDAIIPVQ